VQRLNAEIGKALGELAIRERYAQAALEPVGGSSASLARLLREDYDKYARLIKELNIRLD
jgi:tripartite-type tricarboxylate transporter receptor subunit TctC